MVIGTENTNIQKHLSNYKQIIDNHLEELLKNNSDFQEVDILLNAIKYSSLNGGKRLRSSLCLSTFETLSNINPVNCPDCLTVASVIEIIHAMTLIHDDLPCMDNDDLRRGKPSCHKAFGEANALLAGDAMLTLANNLIIDNCKNLSDSQKLKIISELSKTFTYYIIPGQILDLEFEGKDSNLKDIEKIYRLKTAELIKSSILCGALLYFDIPQKNNLVENDLIYSLSIFGRKIGTGFQIIDDILDITSDTKTLGKTAGKDINQKKSTYPSIIGSEKSKEIAQKLISEAKDELKKYFSNNSSLYLIADFIINRIN